ncbi:hypothetical protein [Nocardia sp. CNY236]|nr:hypothetical protein [Nocardia sp. CNY236]
MHATEFIGGRLAQDILSAPGLYAAVVVSPTDGSEEPVGWAIAFRDGA